MATSRKENGENLGRSCQRAMPLFHAGSCRRRPYRPLRYRRATNEKTERKSTRMFVFLDQRWKRQKHCCLERCDGNCNSDVVHSSKLDSLPLSHEQRQTRSVEWRRWKDLCYRYFDWSVYKNHCCSQSFRHSFRTSPDRPSSHVDGECRQNPETVALCIDENELRSILIAVVADRSIFYFPFVHPRYSRQDGIFGIMR